MGKLYVGTVKYDLTFDLGAKLEGVLTYEIHAFDPNGDKHVWPAQKVDDTVNTIIKHTIETDELIVAGMWGFQPIAIWDWGKVVPCDTVYERVYNEGE
jgi:hypothetical protein